MPALLKALGFLIGTVATFTVVGWTVLVWIPGRARPLALAPLVGVGAMVLWLSLVGLVVPPGSALGAASLVLASTAGLVGALTHRRDRCTLVRAEVIRLSTAVVLGLVCVVPFLSIIAGANSTALVHLSGNHDAFFFTAVPEWLTGHRAVGVTGVTADGSADGVPLLGSTWDLFANHSWRIGSESLTAAFARVLRTDPIDLWLPVTLTYHVLFVVGAQLAASRLGRPGRWTYLVALAVGSCAAAIGGIVEQHTPTILGFALALGLISELVPAAEDGAEAPSPAVVALLATAVAAVYGELFVLLSVPLCVVITIAWWRRRVIDARWIARLGAWGLLLGIVPWVRSARASDEAIPPDGFLSAFDPHLGPFKMAHNLAFGTWWPDVGWADAAVLTRLAVASFLVALVVGLVAVVVVGRNRAVVDHAPRRGCDRLVVVRSRDVFRLSTATIRRVVRAAADPRLAAGMERARRSPRRPDMAPMDQLGATDVHAHRRDRFGRGDRARPGIPHRHARRRRSATSGRQVVRRDRDVGWRAGRDGRQHRRVRAGLLHQLVGTVRAARSGRHVLRQRLPRLLRPHELQFDGGPALVAARPLGARWCECHRDRDRRVERSVRAPRPARRRCATRGSSAASRALVRDGRDRDRDVGERWGHMHDNDPATDVRLSRPTPRSRGVRNAVARHDHA